MSDETFARLAPTLLRCVRRSVSRCSTKELAQSLHVSTSTAIAMARRLDTLLDVAPAPGKKAGMLYVSIRQGHEAEVDALERRLSNELRAARAAAKEPVSAPVLTTVSAPVETTVPATSNVTPAVTEDDDTDAILQSIGVLPATSSDQKGAA